MNESLNKYVYLGIQTGRSDLESVLSIETDYPVCDGPLSDGDGFLSFTL